MLSFRKIVNILVLISYVKMTIVSSFAMDSACFGAHDKIKIEVVRSVLGGELESIGLRVYSKDQSALTKSDYKLVQQDSVNLIEHRFSDNIILYPGQQHKLIQWTVPGLGALMLDTKGEITLNQITNTQNTIKIVTPGIVLFQACALARVRLQAQGAAISDGSQIAHLKARLDKLGSIMLIGDTPQSLGHLDLISGHLHNFGRLNILANARWNLCGNAALNYGTVHIDHPASLIIDNALFFMNLASITGNRLVVLGKRSPITQEQVDTQLALMTNISTIVAQLLRVDTFANLDRNVLNYLIPVIGQTLNLGRINVANMTSNAATIKNADIGSITLTDGTHSTLGRLKNEGHVKIAPSSAQGKTTIKRLNNEGVLDYGNRVVIGRSKFATSSRLEAHTGEAIHFLMPTILRGTIAQAVPMTVKGRVVNQAVFEALSDMQGDVFTLIVDGAFDNQAPMNMLHDLSLNGTGTFTNYAGLKTKRLLASSLKLINRGVLAVTDIQSDTPVFNNTGGKVVASSDVQISGAYLNNQGGQIFAGGKATVTAAELNNTDGQIDGVGGTAVTLTGKTFKGEGGRIGTVKETRLTFAQDTTVEDIGIVAGDKVYLQQDKSGQTITINHGTVTAQTIACIFITNIVANVDFVTSLLYVSSPNWCLSNQAQAARTMVSVLPTQGYQLINPYRTKGTLELWDNGIHSLTDIEKHWESLYGDKTKEKPLSTHTVSILASIQADKGFKFFLPQATLHINSNAAGEMTELLCPENLLHMRVAKFDLERGCVAALSADSWAAHGHHIGRLVQDPTRRVFASFFNPQSSHNLGRYISAVSMIFEGQTYSDVYDGRHLLTLQFFQENGSQFIVRDQSALRGHVVQRALYSARQTTLETDQPSTFVGSTSNFEERLTLKGSGNLTSSLPLGTVNFTYNGTDKRAYELRVGSADSFRVGIMQSAIPLEFLTLASDTHVNQVVGEIRKPCHEHNSPLKSIVVDMTGEQGKAYTHAIDPDLSSVRMFDRSHFRYTGTGGSSRWFKFPPRICSYTYREDIKQAAKFHDITQGLNGGTQVHAPHSSSIDGGMTLVDVNTRIEGIVQSSRTLFAIAQGQNLILGTNNPYYIPPADPFRNLMEGKFHSFNIHLTPGLKELLNNASAPQFLYSMRARFWHDDHAAEAFYAPIINDIVVHHPRDGFRKITGRTIFSLSPDLLLERVRSEVQTVLLRGYVDDNTVIDLEYLQHLHRNASNYLRECKLDAPSVSMALVSGKAATLPDVTKPMLFYTAYINDQGVEELSPRLIIPPAMIDEMRKAKGGYVRTNVLAIMDDTTTYEEALHLFRDQPKLIAEFKQLAESDPEAVGQWDTRAKRAKELKGDPQATQKLTHEFGSTTLLGTIKFGQLGINTSTPLFIRADIEAQDAFIKSLHDILIQSQKERIHTGYGNFYERISTQARIHVANILKIITAENLILESVKTHSGLGTEMKALGSIIDVPIELISHSISVHHGKKRTTTTQTTRTTNVGSNHTSDACIDQGAGVDANLQTVRMKAEKIKVNAGRNINVTDSPDTEQTQSQTKKRSRTISERSGNSISKGSFFEASQASFTAQTGNATFTNTTFACLETDIETLQGLTSFLLGVNEAYYSCVKASRGALWSRTSMINEQHRTYAQSQILGKMRVHSKETLIQLVEGQSAEIIDLIEIDGGPLVKEFLKEIHKVDRKVMQGPGQALMALIAIAMTILTQGAAAPLAAKIGLSSGLVAKAVMGALLSSVATQLTVGQLQNKGNPFKAARTLADKDFLKGLAIKLASAGLTAGIAAHFDIKVPDASMTDKMSNPSLFMQHVAYNAMQESVCIGVRATLGGEKLEDLLKDGLINVGVGSIAQFMASKIGADRWPQLQAENGSISDYMLHKMYHGILGAARGAAFAALRGEEHIGSAALGGAVGGVVAEVVAEAMRGKIEARVFKRVANGETDMGRIKSEEIALISSLGQGAAVIFATLFKCDIGQAQGAAANAIENNAAQFLCAAIAGSMAVWTACEVYDTYRTEGAEAALIHAGVEVGLTVAGVKAFKVAGRAYLTAEAAWGAYLVENPRMAAVAEYCVEHGSKIKDFAQGQGAKLADYVRSSGASKFVSSINTKVEAKFAQWFGRADAGIATGEYERYWTKSTEFKGNKVYQRDDLIDPNLVDLKGMTNLERMMKGRAPYGPDGKKIELHHMLQTQGGAIAELTGTFHKQYSATIHINPSTMPSGINRPLFDKWRESYWVARSSNFKQ